MADHPIDRQMIKNGLTTYDPDHPDAGGQGYVYPTDEEIGEIDDQLNRIQSLFERHLRSTLANIRSPQESDQVQIIKETQDSYFLRDDSEYIWELLNQQDEFDDVVRQFHRGKVSTEPWLDFEGEDGYVITKPHQWRESQWSVDTHLSALVERGLSPAQALDYWMVRVQGKRTGLWAESRGTTAEGVRQNVKKAENTLDETQPEESGERPPYFDRVYRGQRSGESRKVTVDHGYLDPRTDINNMASSGVLTWGYAGSGPSQLSLAILADVVEKEVARSLTMDFRSVVNEFEDKWRLTASEVREWVDNHRSNISE